MGLDGVELVMALEESFGVELKDDEVVRAVTPRMVGDLIFAHLSTTDEKTCQTQRYVPARFKTVRDVVPSVLTSEHIRWTREQVSDLVKNIVMEQLGVSESKYTEDSHFINDLGMG